MLNKGLITIKELWNVKIIKGFVYSWLGLAGIGLVAICAPAYASAYATSPSSNQMSHNHRYIQLAAYTNAFVFNPRKKRWYAYGRNGRIIKSGRASGGASYCRDVRRACRTPRGHFRIISKRGPGCRSSRYPLGRGGAPMPYCMFFSKYYAIHGSYDVPNRNASHGCIRVKPAAARWLSKNFIRIGTRVVVLPY